MKSFLSLATIATSLFLGSSAGQGLTARATNGSCAAVTSTSDDGNFYSVVGVQGAGVRSRMEIRELEKNSIMWNLYIQALAAFQDMSQEDKLSYYSISGIHGAPFSTWDNVNGTGAQTGYCPHMSNIFSTWHRPYLALFEQILHERAVEIAGSFQGNDTRIKYLEAAQQLRMPYWDWAMDPTNSTEGCMPSSLRTPTTTVTRPNGTVEEIANPLYQYKFHPRKPDDWTLLTEAGYPFYDWDTTIRSPPQGYSVNATSDDDSANAAFTAQQVTNRNTLYTLLTTYQTFNEFSNKASGGKIGNIETLHDSIHNTFGGNMGIVMASAFDPVFYLHHVNIDRIVAIYQSRYPSTFIESESMTKATYVWPVGKEVDATTALAPFHMNENGDMWTSTTVRNWESFGYTYPELEGNPSNESLTLKINRLYKPATVGLVNSTIGSPMSHGNRNDTSSSSNTTADALDWYCEVDMPSDIQTSYSVKVFLGAPSNNSNQWPTDPNFVGQVASLAGPQANSSVTVTANIPLTQKLQAKYEAGQLKALDKLTVQQYLQKNLYWRVQRVDLSVIHKNQLPEGLNVTVLSVPVHLPDSELEVPVWINGADGFDYHHNITGHPPSATGAATATSTVAIDATATAVVESTTVEYVTVTSQNVATVSGQPTTEVITAVLPSTIVKTVVASAAESSVYTASEPGGIAGTATVKASSSAQPTTTAAAVEGTSTAAAATTDAPNQTTYVTVVNGVTQTRVETEVVYVTMTVAG